MQFPQFVRSLGFATLALLFSNNFASAQHYQQTNLVSNVAGQAPLTDPNLQNSWGLVHGPTTPWWVSNNAGGTSTLYSIDAAGAAHLVPINPAPNEFVIVPNA